MDIADDDVRIKETCSLSSSFTSDKSKTSFLQRSESVATEKTTSSDIRGKDNSFLKSLRIIGNSSASAKKNEFLRSQSVSNPKMCSSKHDINYGSNYARLAQQSSFSTMTTDDLKNWKPSKNDPISPMSSPRENQVEQPVLTFASNLKDSSHITVGFNLPDDKKE